MRIFSPIKYLYFKIFSKNLFPLGFWGKNALFMTSLGLIVTEERVLTIE